MNIKKIVILLATCTYFYSTCSFSCESTDPTYGVAIGSGINFPYYCNNGKWNDSVNFGITQDCYVEGERASGGCVPSGYSYYQTLEDVPPP